MPRPAASLAEGGSGSVSGTVTTAVTAAEEDGGIKPRAARQRRAHRKSRLGCANCKLRGVKAGRPPSHASPTLQFSREYILTTTPATMRLCSATSRSRAA